MAGTPTIPISSPSILETQCPPETRLIALSGRNENPGFAPANGKDRTTGSTPLSEGLAFQSRAGMIL